MFESVFTLSQAVAQGLAGHPSLGPSGAGALFLWAPLEGGLLLPNLPPPPPPRTLTTPSSLSSNQSQELET